MPKDNLKDDPILDYEKMILIIIKKVIYHSLFYVFINKQHCSNVSLS